MFSCDLCYSDRRIILSYCEKRKVNYYVCKKNNIFLSTNNKVSCYKYLHSRAKTTVSYYIILRENKSIILHHIIILHHVLPNSPENVLLAAFVMLKLQQQCTNCQTKNRTIFQVKEENGRSIWLSQECFTARKQNVSKG